MVVIFLNSSLPFIHGLVAIYDILFNLLEDSTKKKSSVFVKVVTLGHKLDPEAKEGITGSVQQFSK